jgi:DNA-binding GntR family transcriptional regulator
VWSIDHCLARCIIELQSLGHHASLHDRAYDSLREAILKHDFRPGERLFEADLATKLGISRSPVREAIRRLQQDGLVEIRPRTGVFVAPVPANDEIDALYRVRAALEGVAASLATERATPDDLSKLDSLILEGEKAVGADDIQAVIEIAADFHQTIHAAAQSQRLFALLQQIYGQVLHLRSYTLRMPGRAAGAMQGHADLLDRLKEGDPERAEKAMRDHVDKARFALLKEIETKGPDWE